VEGTGPMNPRVASLLGHTRPLTGADRAHWCDGY